MSYTIFRWDNFYLTMVVERPGGAIAPIWHVLAAQNPANVTPRNASAGKPAQGFLIHAYITNLGYKTQNEAFARSKPTETGTSFLRGRGGKEGVLLHLPPNWIIFSV